MQTPCIRGRCRTVHPSAVETMKGPHDDVGTGVFAIGSVDACAGGSA